MDDVINQAIDKLDEPVGEPKVEVPKVDPEPKADDKKEPEDEGYTADDGANEEEPKPKEELKIKEPDTTGMNDVSKYIIENLPLITTRLKDTDGSIKEVQVKSWTQLPNPVEFASKRDELAFNNAMTSQEITAHNLQNKYQQNKQTDDLKDFERRENEAIREDIATLQRAGDLPKFKVKVDDPEFDNDPGAQEVQKVLEFMNKANENYLKAYNEGKAYRHIDFSTAFALYARANPTKADDQKKEDQERKEMANKVAGNRGLASTGIKKPTAPQGATVQQILDRIDQEF